MVDRNTRPSQTINYQNLILEVVTRYFGSKIIYQNGLNENFK